MIGWLIALWAVAAWDKDRRAPVDWIPPDGALRAIRHGHAFENGKCLGCAMPRRRYAELLARSQEQALCEAPPVQYSTDMDRLLLIERIQQDVLQNCEAQWLSAHRSIGGFYRQPDIVQKVDALERTVARLDYLEARVTDPA